MNQLVPISETNENIQQNSTAQNPYTQILKKLVLIRNIPQAIKVSHNEFIAMIQRSDIFSFVLQLSRSEQYFCFAVTPAYCGMWYKGYASRSNLTF